MPVDRFSIDKCKFHSKWSEIDLEVLVFRFDFDSFLRKEALGAKDCKLFFND